jgi:acetyl-CoA acetyltransferase
MSSGAHRSPLRGAAAIVGIGRTPWYKHGTAPATESTLALRAITAAAEDAGLDTREIDGFVSWGSERNAGQNLMTALGMRDMRFGALMWVHGGGSAGSIGLATMAIATGQAEVVVVIRAMAEKDPDSRVQTVVSQGNNPPMPRVHGLSAPVQGFGLSGSRMLEHDGLTRDALWAFVRACYYHAARNPEAYGRDSNLSRELYEASRCPAAPLHLYDISRENDAAIALILVAAERARYLKQRPAYVLSSTMGRFGGRDHSFSEAPDGHTTAGYRSAAGRMWAQSGYKPADVDVAQFYANASSMAVNGIVDHGFCSWETVTQFVTFENLIAPYGLLPVNTAGGDLADGFIHGAANNFEAVRQIRGTSPNQVPDAHLSLVTGGPGDHFVSTTLLGSEATL